MSESYTQNAMNETADTALRAATEDCDAAYRALQSIFSEASRESVELERSQDAFRHYCGAMERFAFTTADGGTVGPLVRANILKRLVTERTGLLQSLREDFRGRETS